MSVRMNIVFIALILAVIPLLNSVQGMDLQTDQDNGSSQDKEAMASIVYGISSDLQDHDPIRIDSNSGFNSTNGVTDGNGTVADPWMINGWKISGKGYGNCIFIGNTTDHFIIEENILWNASGYSAIYHRNTVIYLYNTSNGSVINNSIFSGHTGIFIETAYNLMVLNNTIYHNYLGVSVDKCDNSTFSENRIRDNTGGGMKLTNSPDNEYISNTILRNSGMGLGLIYCAGSNIRENRMDGNDYGIYINYHGNDLIENNTISNATYGMLMWHSPNNIIKNNTFSYNENCGAHLDDDCDDNQISDNRFIENSDGLVIDNADRNDIFNNYFSENDGTGLLLSGSHFNTVYNNSFLDGFSAVMIQGNNNHFYDCDLKRNANGIYLRFNSMFNTFSNLSISSHSNGIILGRSNQNTINNCTIKGSRNTGISISQMSNSNSVFDNTVIDTREWPIFVNGSSNHIYHNNFIDFGESPYADSINQWDNGYPGGGNYWDRYKGIDRYNGPNQDIIGHDGIADSPFKVGTGADNYPLMSRIGFKDTTAPLITDPVIVAVTFNSSTVEWSSNEPCNSIITYSQKYTLEQNITIFDQGMVFKHQVTIDDLDIDTEYFFLISSADYRGNSAMRNNETDHYSFRTSTSEVPIIRDLSGEYITTGENYTLNVEVQDDWGISYVQVEYWFDDEIHNTSHLELNGSHWAHNIPVPLWTETFHYILHVEDLEGNSISNPERTMSVMDNDPPTIISMSHDNVSTGDGFEIRFDIKDNIRISQAFIEVWTGDDPDSINITLVENKDGIWLAELTGPADPNDPINCMIQIFDSSGNHYHSIFQILNISDNDDPIAEAGPDLSIENGDIVIFDGSTSQDNDNIMNYTWSFVYEAEVVYLYTSSPSFKFDRPGYYSVDLMVMDPSGNIGGDDLLLTVIDIIPPVAIISGELTVESGNSINLDGVASTDNGHISKYVWRFWDGADITVEGPYLNHSFSIKGIHKVNLTIYDEWDLSDTESVDLEIKDYSSPVAVAGDDIVVPLGEIVLLNGSGSYDDSVLTMMIWTFTYNGEEKILTGSYQQFKFEISGTYQIALKVYDQSGNSDIDSIQVTVVDRGILKGVVLGGDGEGIFQALVEVVGPDGVIYSTMTKANGSFEIEVPQGSLFWIVSKEGYEPISGKTDITASGTSTLSGQSLILEKEANEGEKGSMIFLIIVLILSLITILLIIALLRKKIRERDGIRDENDPGKDDPNEAERGISDDPIEEKGQGGISVMEGSTSMNYEIQHNDGRKENETWRDEK